jgi:hypothetical protein
MAHGPFRQKPFVVPGNITNKANTLARPIAEFFSRHGKNVGEEWETHWAEGCRIKTR